YLAQRLKCLKCQTLIAAHFVNLVIIAERQKILRISRILIGRVKVDITLRGTAALFIIAVAVIRISLHDNRALGQIRIRIKALDLGKALGGQRWLVVREVKLAPLKYLLGGEVFVVYV